MVSRTTARFRRAYAALPERVRARAREAYRTFVRGPQHPGLRLKPVHPTRPTTGARPSRRRPPHPACCSAALAALICGRTRADGRKVYPAALAHPGDPCAFARALAGVLAGVYATDPACGDKLVAVMRSRGLLETFGFPPA